MGGTGFFFSDLVRRLAIQDDGRMWFYPNRSRTGWRRIVVAPKRGREWIIDPYYGTY